MRDSAGFSPDFAGRAAAPAARGAGHRTSGRGDRQGWFAILADPTRLALLTCIKAAGPNSVSDLAAATGVNDTTVSQTLRYLRAARTVSTERDGRIIRYRLADDRIAALLVSG